MENIGITLNKAVLQFIIFFILLLKTFKNNIITKSTIIFHFNKVIFQSHSVGRLIRGKNVYYVTVYLLKF